MFSIDIISVDITVGRMSVHLRVEGELYTTPALAQKVLADKPNLAFHSCKNECGALFGDVIADTSIPHLVEHLIIDEQLRSVAQGDSRIFAGNTRWVKDFQKTEGASENKLVRDAKVVVNFADDLVALSSLVNTLAYLDALQRGTS